MAEASTTLAAQIIELGAELAPPLPDAPRAPMQQEFARLHTLQMEAGVPCLGGKRQCDRIP